MLGKLHIDGAGLGGAGVGLGGGGIVILDEQPED